MPHNFSLALADRFLPPLFVFLVFLNVSSDIKSEIRLESYGIDSLVATFGNNFSISHRSVTLSQAHACDSIPVRLFVRKSTPVAGSKPSRIPRPKTGAKQLVILAAHLPTQIPVPSPRLPPFSAPDLSPDYG